MQPMRLPALAAVAAALAFGLGSTAVASTQSPGVRLAQQQQTFSETELKQYAMAVLEVMQISQEYRPQMEAASSSDERTAIQSKAGEEMVEAVRGAGLSVETYNQIYNAAQADPNLADKIDEYIREAQ